MLRADEPELGGLSQAQSDYDQQLQSAMDRLLALESVQCRRNISIVGGRRLHYLEAGDGQPLVLLHGAGGGAANWYRLLGPLSQHWRVLAPDLPGFGFSDPIDPVAPLGRHVAQVLRDWLDCVEAVRPHVIGTSFGGLAALRLPQYYDIDKIVAIDAVGIASRLPLLLRLATLPLLARLVVSPTRRGTRLMLRHALTSTPLPLAHEDALVDYLFASAKRSAPALMARAFVRFAGAFGQRDVLTNAELTLLRDRLLLVWGAKDEFLPLSDIQRAAALAGCESVRIIPHAGHSPNWENPQALLEVIEDFLNTRTG